MLITKQELISRTKLYIADEMLSHQEGLPMFLGSIALNLFANNATKTVDKYLSSPAFKMLDIVTDDGLIDIEKVYNAYSESENTFTPIVVDLEIIGMGKYTFKQDDIKTIYKYLKGEN